MFECCRFTHAVRLSVQRKTEHLPSQVSGPVFIYNVILGHARRPVLYIGQRASEGYP